MAVAVTPSLNTFVLQKINSIEVIWIGSSLSGDNPSEDASTAQADGTKTAGKKNIIKRYSKKWGERTKGGETQSGGETKTISAGRTSRKYSAQFVLKSVSDKRALQSILFGEEECTLTDINGAKVRVFIDSYSIEDSISSIGRSEYSLSFTIQEGGIVPPVNAKTDLLNARDLVRERIRKNVEANKTKFSSMTSDEYKNKIKEQISKAKKLGKNIEPLERMRLEALEKYPAGILSFVDPVTDLMRSGLEKFLEVKIAVFSPIIRDRVRVTTTKKLVNAIRNLDRVPSEFIDLVTDLARDLGLVQEIEASPFDVVTKSEILPEYIPEINGESVEKLSPKDIEELPTRERESIARQWVVCRTLNMTKVMSDINLLLSGEFANEEDFKKTLNQIYGFVEYCGLDGEDIRSIVHSVNMYANTQDYMSVTTIEVKNFTPLLRIVYDLYGDLENYSVISALNGFKNNARVRGTVKVLV